MDYVEVSRGEFERLSKRVDEIDSILEVLNDFPEVAASIWIDICSIKDTIENNYVTQSLKLEKVLKKAKALDKWIGKLDDLKSRKIS